MERLQHEFDAIGFFLSGHPLDAYASVLAKLGIVRPSRSSRHAPIAARRPGASPASSSSARERRSQKGNKFAFAHVLGADRPVRGGDLLRDAGRLAPPAGARDARCCSRWKASATAEALKLRVQSIQSLDEATEGLQRGLKVVLDGRAFQADAKRLDELKAMLKPGGKGIVCLSMMLQDRGREVEIAMPGRFDISPAQKGAISTVPGVLEVVDF